MKLLTLFVALCVCLIATSSANAALVASGDGQTVYDTDLNITWLANARVSATNTFGLATGVNLGTDSYGNQSIISSDGSMTWGGAIKWIAAMNAANFRGYNDWRLPTTLQPDPSCSFFGLGCTGSEMGHLYYTELNGPAGIPIMSTVGGGCHGNCALFQGLASTLWSGTEFALSPADAWVFSGSGEQYHVSKNLNSNYYAFAVRSGQVAIPVPAAAWLLGSGLLGLIGVARRRSARQ